MPIYTYTPEDADGEPVERMYAYPPPEKIQVAGTWYDRAPGERVAVVGLKPEPAQGDEVLRGYYTQECVHGSRFRSRFSRDQIMSAWKDDALSGDEKAADEGNSEAASRLASAAPAAPVKSKPMRATARQ